MMMNLLSKKWNINAEMGFIEVDVNFFIGLKIINISCLSNDALNLTKVETDGGIFIIENNDWNEIQSELRKIKIDKILKSK